MVDLYIIETKKAVHKPFEVPYFITTEPTIASWFYFSSVVGNTGEKHLYSVSNNEWNKTPFTPYPEFNRSNVSPSLKIFPVYVFGTVAPFKLSDGTTYSNWFTPKAYGLTFEDAEARGLNAYVEVPANIWHPHHIFRDWKTIN